MIVSPKSTQDNFPHHATKEPNQVTESQAAIIKTCLYYSFFNYPLKIEEIKSGVSLNLTNSEFDEAIRRLVDAEKITKIKEYYGVGICNEFIDRRIKEEARFQAIQSKIKRSSRIISKFPYVRGIGVSGSVSKGLVKEDGDVDFFIICKNDRLWLCRSLLVLNKKLLRLNSRKYFCINYFIGDESLRIPDQNIFVATELESLVPVYGNNVIESLKEQNSWSKEYLPHYHNKHSLPQVPAHNNLLKKGAEKLLNNRLGGKLDNYFRKKTLQRWHKKFPDFTKEQFEIAMRSSRNVSKHHPSNFQLKILDYIETEYQRIFAIDE